MRENNKYYILVQTFLCEFRNIDQLQKALGERKKRNLEKYPPEDNFIIFLFYKILPVLCPQIYLQILIIP